jgi:uncharacterized membrane protein
MTTALAFACALGCGINAGVFYAFSTFVMPGLARIPAPTGAAAMQSINITAPRPPFMLAFMGTALLCIAALVTAATGPREAGWLVAGALLYLLGTLGVTVAFNVPRNNALAAADPDAPETAELWARYLREWTAWNHVRTLAALAAAAAFTAWLT